MRARGPRGLGNRRRRSELGTGNPYSFCFSIARTFSWNCRFGAAQRGIDPASSWNIYLSLLLGVCGPGPMPVPSSYTPNRNQSQLPPGYSNLMRDRGRPADVFYFIHVIHTFEDSIKKQPLGFARVERREKWVNKHIYITITTHARCHKTPSRYLEQRNLGRGSAALERQPVAGARRKQAHGPTLPQTEREREDVARQVRQLLQRERREGLGGRRRRRARRKRRKGCVRGASG